MIPPGGSRPRWAVRRSANSPVSRLPLHIVPFFGGGWESAPSGVAKPARKPSPGSWVIPAPDIASMIERNTASWRLRSEAYCGVPSLDFIPAESTTSVNKSTITREANAPPSPESEASGMPECYPPVVWVARTCRTIRLLGGVLDPGTTISRATGLQPVLAILDRSASYTRAESPCHDRRERPPLDRCLPGTDLSASHSQDRLHPLHDARAGLVLLQLRADQPRRPRHHLQAVGRQRARARDRARPRPRDIPSPRACRVDSQTSR